jgi:U3 small nucleolar RNA-associated protein 14
MGSLKVLYQNQLKHLKAVKSLSPCLRAISMLVPGVLVDTGESLLIATGGGGRITVADLMGSLEGSAGGLGALKKRLERVEGGSGPVSAPLPRVIKERIERQAGYEHTKQDIARWQPLVKANREAPTIVFSDDNKGTVQQLSTAGMTAKFVPTTDLEKEISELLKESGVEDGRTVEAGEALELNKLTVEEVGCVTI